jgi:hypothetical protein
MPGELLHVAKGAAGFDDLVRGAEGLMGRRLKRASVMSSRAQ